MSTTAPSEAPVSCRLDRNPVQVSAACARARSALPRWGLGEHADLAELIVSELVTNAITHDQGEIEVRLSCASGHLLAEVHDDGPGRPVRRHPGADDERGRGLELIDRLIDRHGGTRGVVADHDSPGKTVYVALSLGTSAEGPR